MKRAFAAALVSAAVCLTLHGQETFPPPEFVPQIPGAKVVHDYVGETAEQQKTLYTVDVPASIDPSGHHTITVWGIGRGIDLQGGGKRGMLAKQLSDSFAAARYEVLSTRNVEGRTLITARSTSHLDETWIEAAVSDDAITLRETRSTIRSGEMLGEAPLTADLVRMMTQALPVPTGETFTDADDFPFLRHVPGQKLVPDRTRHRDAPLIVRAEKILRSVDGPVIEKVYRQDRFVTSSFRSLVAYREGLRNAGWKTTFVDTGILDGIGIIDAHYDREGRDLWAHLVFGGDEQSFTVADGMNTTSVDALKKAIAGDGASVYGIHVDGEGQLFTESQSLAGRIADALFGDSVGRFVLNVHVTSSAGPGRASTIAELLTRMLAARGIEATKLATAEFADLKSGDSAIDVTRIDIKRADPTHRGEPR